MKNFFIELKNKIFYILSHKIQLILFLSIIISFYFFLSTPIYTSKTEEKKHLRNLDMFNKTNPEKGLEKEKNIINNNSFITNDTLLSNNSNINYNDTNNSISDELDIVIKVKPLKINITEKILFYQFVKSISTGFYYGDWENLNVKKNRLNDKKGKGYLNLYKKNGNNYLLNLGESLNSSKISVYFTIKDGEYIDNYLEGNFTFTLEDISLIDLKNESISFVLNDVPISYFWEEYIEAKKLNHLNHALINLTFYKKFRQFEDYMGYKLTSNDYGNVSLEIKNATNFINNVNYTNDINNSNIMNNSFDISNKSYNPFKDDIGHEKNFEISFRGLAYGDHRYSKSILNYSIFASVFCIIEIYLSSDFVKLVSTNDQMALNTDIYTILFHIMWTSLVCGVHFFMSLIKKSSAYEYSMPSFFYFCLFSIFLLRILYLAWRARNRDITDIQLLRKKLLRFYLLFYLFLYTTLISVKLWYSYFFFTFILFASTWIFQIIYSAKKGTKPPMSYLYIFSTSFSKISLSIYIKAYKNNIFGYRPNYTKVLIVSFVIIIEVIILFLQKFFGPKIIIPKRFRAKVYNYYKNEKEISDNDKHIECVICLDKIGNIEILEEGELHNVKSNSFKKRIIKYLEKLKKQSENKENYMLTPCHHLFHTRCLESWLNVKNQCPCCRQEIPPLEN